MRKLTKDILEPRPECFGKEWVHDNFCKECLYFFSCYTFYEEYIELKLDRIS